MYRFIILSLCCQPFFSASAQTNTPEGLEYCTVCHGSQLMGNANIAAPRLSGLPAWYVEGQLLNFKKGLRGKHSDDAAGAEMQQMVTELSDEEISAIAEWVSSTESPHPEPSLIADVAAGEQLYVTCSACHGATGEGMEAMNSPPLAGLNDWYIKTQLEHYRDNIRGNAAEDVNGMIMKSSMALIQSDEDILNLAAYINELSGP